MIIYLPPTWKKSLIKFSFLTPRKRRNTCAHLWHFDAMRLRYRHSHFCERFKKDNREKSCTVWQLKPLSISSGRCTMERRMTFVLMKFHSPEKTRTPPRRFSANDTMNQIRNGAINSWMVAGSRRRHRDDDLLTDSSRVYNFWTSSSENGDRRKKHGRGWHRRNKFYWVRSWFNYTRKRLSRVYVISLWRPSIPPMNEKTIQSTPLNCTHSLIVYIA